MSPKFAWIAVAAYCLMFGLTLIAVQQSVGTARAVEEATEEARWQRQATSQMAAARKAYEMGNVALKAGNRQRARLFFLSAVNHDPTDFEYLSAYAEAAKSDDASGNEIERARSVLELAVYQVAPEQIDKTLDILTHLRNRESGRPTTAAAAAQATTGSETDYAAELMKLHAVDVGIYKDPAALQRQVEGVRALIASLADDDAQDDNADGVKLRKEADAELARWGLLANLVRQCDYVDACLQKIKDSVARPDSDVAVSLLQAAENALPQFWGEDLSQVPAELSKKILEYPAQVCNWTLRLADARSKPLLKELSRQSDAAIAEAKVIVEAKATVEAKGATRFEAACKRLESALRAMSSVYAKITSVTVRNDADKVLENVGNALRDQRIDQFNAYQKWALDKLDKGFTDWDNLHVYTSESNALKIYEDDALYEIDPTLLSAEVGRLHGDVLNKLFPNMSPRKQVEMWRKNHDRKVALKEF